MIDINCKSEVYVSGFCEVSAESQEKKSRHKGRDLKVWSGGLVVEQMDEL